MTAILKLILIMKITVSATVRGQITATVSIAVLFTVRTAATAVMNTKTIHCPMGHGIPTVLLSISGQSPVPAGTVPRKYQAIL